MLSTGLQCKCGTPIQPHRFLENGLILRHFAMPEANNKCVCGGHTINPHGSPDLVLFQITLTSCDLELFELTPPFRNIYLDFKFQRAPIGDGLGSFLTLSSNSLFTLSGHHVSVTVCQELIARSLRQALQWSLSSCPQPTGCSSAHWCLPERLWFLFHKPNLWTF